MDRICPLLTLGSDRRAVCDAFDADHRCGAPGGPDPISRSQQLGFCLDASHAECPHYVRNALMLGQAGIEGVPPPSSDVMLAPTRLVIEAENSWAGIRRRTAWWSVGRALVAAVVLIAVGTGAVASGAAEHVVALLDSGSQAPAAFPGGGAAASGQTTAPTQLPSATAAPSASAPASPTSTPTIRPASSPIASTSPAVPAARRYVVQEGDTLRAIADRFGTTVAALKQANGIADENLIEVGRILTVP